ncbi:hypothetical protein FRB90_007918 [Tulasnella sp. 427]|nr:hypothetical protein FRB90_007918 [Tulasnella sp. 427]
MHRPPSPVRGDLPYDRTCRLPTTTPTTATGAAWDRHSRPVSPTTSYPPSRSSSALVPSYNYRGGGLQHSWEGSEPSTPRERDALPPAHYPPPPPVEYRERDRDWDYRGHAAPSHLPPSSANPAWSPNDPQATAWSDSREPRRPSLNPPPSSTSGEWAGRTTWDDRTAEHPSLPPQRGAWERPESILTLIRSMIHVGDKIHAQILTLMLVAGFPRATSLRRVMSVEALSHFLQVRPLTLPSLHRRPELDIPLRTGRGFRHRPLFIIQLAPPTAPRADRILQAEYERRAALDRERDLIIKREEIDEPPPEWKSAGQAASKHSTGSSVVYAGERGGLPALGSANRAYSQNGYVPSPRNSTPSSYSQEPPPSRYQLPPLHGQPPDRAESIQRLREDEQLPYSSPERRPSFSRPPVLPSHSRTPEVPPEPQYGGSARPRHDQSPSRTSFASIASHGRSDIPTPNRTQEQHRDEQMRPASMAHSEFSRQRDAPDTMEVDASTEMETPRVESRLPHGLEPDRQRQEAVPIPMDTHEDYARPPSERAVSPEEPARRASGDEEEEEAPRRARPVRKAGRKRGGRPSRRTAEDLEDDPIRQLMAANMPSAQMSEAIGNYLKSNKRFEPDSDFDWVEDVLSQTRHLSDLESSRQPTTADDLVDEIAMSAQTAALVRDYCDSTRDAIVTRVKRGYEEVNIKVKKLRTQYLALNREWEMRCAELDREKQVNGEKQASKTPVPTTPGAETPTFSGNSFFNPVRSTRRNTTAGGLGNLMADAVRSDLEFEQVMASLGNEDLVDPNILSIRNAAAIPDMLSVQPRTQPLLDVVYDDTNGVVEYPEQFYDVSNSLGDWTEEEKEIFMEQFAVNGKQFGKIAEHLPHKTAEQCVLFYYISKKSLVDYGDVLNNKKYARGRRKVLARRNIASHLGKQKGNALLTDIRTTAGEATPADSPSGSPKNTDIELGPVAPRRRGRPPANAANGNTDNRTRPLRVGTRGRRGASPESEGETPAIAASGDEGSSSENDAEAPSATEGGRRTNRRRAAADRNQVSAMLASIPAEKKNPKKGRPSSHWSTLERKVYLEQLALYGKSWYHIAQEVKTKTPAQCRNFYKANEEEMELDKIVKAWEAQHRGSESEPEPEPGRGDKGSPSPSSVTPEETGSKVSGIEALRNIQNAKGARPVETQSFNDVHGVPRRPDSTSGQTGRVFSYSGSETGQPSNTTYSQPMSPYANGSGSWAQRQASTTFAQPATFLPTPSSTVYASARVTSGVNSAPGASNPLNPNGTAPPKPAFSTFDSPQRSLTTRSPASPTVFQRPAFSPNGKLGEPITGSKPNSYVGNGLAPSPSNQSEVFGLKPNLAHSQSSAIAVDASSTMDGLD